MYYIDFWTTYWRNLAELTEGTACQTPPNFTEIPSEAEGSPSSRKDSSTRAAHAQDEVGYKQQISPDEKYAYLTEYGTQILALFAADGSCNYVSKNFETITGYGKQAAVGDGFYGIIAPESRERLQEMIRLQHSAHTPQFVRAKITHANHKNQWYSFMLHPKKQASQAEIVCVVENIHENMLAQNTLQKARMEAELALRSRSEFLANMSHDLRTPLNAVLGFAQMITGEVLGKIDNPQYMDYAHHIQESGYDLLAKVEDLLEIASLDAGRVTLDREQVALGEILKRVVDAQAHHAAARQVKLVCDATNHRVMLNVDRVKVQHMMGHLIANAIKQCHEGSQINIRTGKIKEGGFRLRITDNGSGMDNIRLTQVKSALAQENCWTSKHSHGIGIGLALTKEFVGLHGGQLLVESELGEGTTIDILLPRDCLASSQVTTKIDYLRQYSNVS